MNIGSIKIRSWWLLSISLIIFTPVQFCLAQKENYCIDCHSELNEDIVKAFENDVHAQAGLSCVDCHGGNPALDDDESMSPRYGFVGVPSKKNQPEFCGKCHSDPNYMRNYNPSLPIDQVDKYWTSRHGKLLKDNDEKVATCANCHNAHGILPPNTPKSSVYPLNVPATCAECHANADYMAEYDIPTDQYVQYTDSLNVHGYALFVKRDLSAPVCNDCHGNHGAIPPGVSNVAQVCNQCHGLNAELFSTSRHKEAFDALEVSECAFCHQAEPDIQNPHARIHTIVRSNYKLIGTGEGKLCGQCHSRGDNGWVTATLIATWRNSLADRLEEVQSLLHAVEKKGFEISDAQWLLDSEVKQAKMEMRTMIHSFNAAQYEPVFAKADSILNGVQSVGQDASREVFDRRSYFFIITFIIILLIIALIFKIQEIERDSD